MEKEKNLKKRVYSYALKVINFIEKLPKNLTNQVIGKQLLRSGTSITANIIEAQSASSKKDFINFYSYSLKSANESELWISLLKDSGKLERIEAEELLQETKEIARMIAASIITIRKNIRNPQI